MTGIEVFEFGIRNGECGSVLNAEKIAEDGGQRAERIGHGACEETGMRKSEYGSDWNAEVGMRNAEKTGMRPPARRGHRGLRPGGKVEVTGRSKSEAGRRRA